MLIFVRCLDTSGLCKRNLVSGRNLNEASPRVWCSAAAWPRQTSAKGMPAERFMTWKWRNGVVAWAWWDVLWNVRPLIVLSSYDARRVERNWRRSDGHWSKRINWGNSKRVAPGSVSDLGLLVHESFFVNL